MYAIHGRCGDRQLAMRPRRSLAAVAIVAAPLLQAPPAVGQEQPEAFDVCMSCHSYQKGEPPLVGPPLWGVFGRRVASVEGYQYSPALLALGGTWERARLDRFLTMPKAFAPGTRMNMGGLPDDAERSQVLDFLETLRPDKSAPVGDPAPGKPGETGGP
jgi:cytochrome c